MDEGLADDYESLPEHYSRGTHMLAGALAGMTEHCLIYPIDTIKTRMQVLPLPANVIASAGATGNGSVSRQVYMSLTTVVRAVVSTEGLGAFWRGIPSVLISAGPAHALYFATYEECKVRLGFVPGAPVDVRATSLAGACATIAHDSLMTPFDVLKQRMQLGRASLQSCHRGAGQVLPCASASSAEGVQAACAQTFPRHGSATAAVASAAATTGSLRYRSLWHCFTHTLGTEGVRAFYVSLPTTLMMNVPFHTIHFSTYELMRRLLLPIVASPPPTLSPTDTAPAVYSPLTHVVSGGIAGGAAALLTTPLDVVKTLLQTRGVSPCAEIRACNSMRGACQILYRREGFRGFWRGSQARVLAHMPATALSWLVYEYFKAALGTSATSTNSREFTNNDYYDSKSNSQSAILAAVEQQHKDGLPAAYSLAADDQVRAHQ